ncbi:MAG TPA: hypothetical protein VKR52_05025 [Terracidiphilus sp.]|nr:hypothetical protein [Terracidiphilus sp.]
MRQEVYRVAHDEAKAELGEILGKFEQLRLRKDRIEAVVEALKPLLAADAQAESAAPAPNASSGPAEETSEELPEPIPMPVAQATEDAGDPFQRRVENALGVGSGGRDIREYSRLFNGGSSR